MKTTTKAKAREKKQQKRMLRTKIKSSSKWPVQVFEEPHRNTHMYHVCIQRRR